MVDRITGPAEPIDALTQITRSRLTLLVAHAGAATKGVGIADGMVGDLAARDLGVGITRSAASCNAAVPLAGSLLALLVRLTQPADQTLAIADRRIGGLAARRVVDRITDATRAVDTLCPGAGSRHTFGVDHTRSAHQLSRLADRPARGDIAAGMGLGIASHAATFKALVEAARTAGALRRRSTRPTTEVGGIAYGRGRSLSAGVGPLGIASSTAALDTGIAPARTLVALLIAAARTAVEPIGVTDGCGRALVAGLMISGVTGPAAPLHTLIEPARSGGALRVAQTGATHKQSAVAHGRLARLIAAGVLCGGAMRAATLHAVVQVTRPVRTLNGIDTGATDAMFRIADGGRRSLSALRVQTGITLVATTEHTRVPDAGPVDTLLVALARPTLEPVGVTQGHIGGLLATRMVTGIARQTEALDTLVVRSGM